MAAKATLLLMPDNCPLRIKLYGQKGLNMTINEKLSAELNLKQWQVDNTIALIDEGNTIPFISRYRKEVTGELNDEVLRNFEERLN